ncbi:hypothetical protein [Phycicoccus sp.]|uniref:hypothetical protein n=1 Tax=Phycicoccus sp. TaxID=1902410 RepID=UPI002BCB751D|nr:hypothetical protein [Phycicoccus sp.]HMM93427.1 hypothetical protein [Phycicoccus sp.]
MNLDMISTALRWTFWSLLYLGIMMTALVVCLGMAAPYLPLWARWTGVGAFLAGIAVDVHVKTRPARAEPPVDGEPVRIRRHR